MINGEIDDSPTSQENSLASENFTRFFETMNNNIEFFVRNTVGWGYYGTSTFHPVMTHKSEVYRFYIFKINILAELVYLIIFCLFLLFKTY